MLLIDVLGDPQSVPIFIWAGTALLIGVLTYYWQEGWSILDSLYFCVVTQSTICFGDLTPTTPLAKGFTILYVINGIGILLALFDRFELSVQGRWWAVGRVRTFNDREHFSDPEERLRAAIARQ